jgi:hypothetical protein
MFINNKLVDNAIVETLLGGTMYCADYSAVFTCLNCYGL